MTVLGTRPEIIRLSRVIPLLDEFCEHIVVYTGQNFEYRLSELFFDQLQVRAPNHRLEVRGASFAEQISNILTQIEPLFLKYRPDRVLILGDTNSGLSAILARKLGIPVYHMEAGNRCFDFRVPEESNRRLIDHVSSVLMPYTNRSRENLLREGFAPDCVYVTGNPIKQVMEFYSQNVENSTIIDDLHLEAKKYFLVTLHRAENVDSAARLREFWATFAKLHAEFEYPVICSLHPRTRSRLVEFGISESSDGIQCLEPLGLFDFLRLERSALCLLSDSGTVQEEACILGVPNVTLRDVTERPETIECGSNVLVGCNTGSILSAVMAVTTLKKVWQPPWEYLEDSVAEKTCRILLGAKS